MPTVKPANFPRIHAGLTPPSQTNKGAQLRQPQKNDGTSKASNDRAVPNLAAESERPSEQLTLHASQARVLKLYDPKMLTIKQPARLGQIIDIKI